MTDLVSGYERRKFKNLDAMIRHINKWDRGVPTVHMVRPAEERDEWITVEGLVDEIAEDAFEEGKERGWNEAVEMAYDLGLMHDVARDEMYERNPWKEDSE